MTFDTRTLVPAIGAFLASAVVAFLLGQTLGGGDAGAAELPLFASPDPVVVPIEVPDGADPGDFSEALLVDIQTERELASEIGVSYTPPGSGGSSESVTTSGGSSTAADDGGTPSGGADPSTDPLPADSEPLPDERAVDLCAIEDVGTDACPDGVGGTILLALRTVDLAAKAVYAPSPPEARTWFSQPVCPSDAYVPGETLIGVSATKPVDITIEYRQGRWIGGGYEVDGTVTATTSTEAEAAWMEWFDDESLSDRIPEAWIQHCVSIDLPPRNGYSALVIVTDKYDPSMVVAAHPRQLTFNVPLDDGSLIGERRRPTTLLGYGIDDLRVGVTKTPEQDVNMVAVPDLTPGVCDTGGDDRSVIDREDGVNGREIVNNVMESAIFEDPEYPWLRDHTRSVVHQLSLEEGTDYTLCIYWFGAGPSFDARVVEISEATIVGTPEAWRPRLILEDLTNLFGELESVTVSAPGCPAFTTEDLVIDRSAGWDWVGEPVELCRYDSGLTELDRGIRMGAGVIHSDGVGEGHRPFIRTDLRCDVGPCLLRLDEIAIVPLPSVPTERRLCGSGFGSGCDGDIPRRSAGDAVVRIVYDASPGNGRTEWSFGAPEDVDITPPPLGETPQVDVDVEYEIRSNPGLGVRANVTVTADRPVSIRVEAVQIDPVCDAFGAPPYEDPGLAEVHTFSLETLCLGTRYRLNVSGQDGSGNDVIVVPDRFGEPRPYEDINVPPVWAFLDMSATVIAPNDDTYRYGIELLPVRVRPETVEPPTGAALDWSMSPLSRSEARLSQWIVLASWGTINVCGGDDAEVLSIEGAHRRGALLGQEDIRIIVEANVWRYHQIGGPYGECARDEIVRTTVIDVTVDLVDLVEGVTLRSDDGTLEVTLDIGTWRDELIG